jgi:N-methylhydantoinase A
MAAAPLARDFLTTVRRVNPSATELARLGAPLARRGIADLMGQGVARKAITVRTVAQMRYAGQSHEIEIPLTADYRADFDATHDRMYGHASRERPVEVLALRIEVTGTVEPTPSRRAAARARRAPASVPHMLTWRGRTSTVPRYERDALPPGTRFAGPALVVEYSSTTLVPPGWRALVDGEGHLHLEARP